METKYKYQSGDKHGMLMLTGKAYRGYKSSLNVETICVCGKIKWTDYGKLLKRENASCGCIIPKLAKERATKHGLFSDNKSHPIASALISMKDRCYNNKNKRFVDYGGRGIVVCEEWLNSPNKFYEWALNNGWSKGLTIDRVDGDGNYEPNNCRWTTVLTQNRNRRGNYYFTFCGEKKCAAEWSIDSRCNIPDYMLISRRKKGWDDVKAITTPYKKRERKQC